MAPRKGNAVAKKAIRGASGETDPAETRGGHATMQDCTERKGARGRLRRAVGLRVAGVGGLPRGAGTAMAAPGGHAAATATTAATAMPADAGQANGKGQANGQST